MTTYTPTEEDVRKVENGLAYHPVQSEEQGWRYQDNRAAAKTFADTLLGNCPPSDELSLALTKLREALYWANAAIAINEA